ncbi:MAG: pilus assembly protein N-terminal domain-containing protein [Roseiarcus sp.]
MLRPVLFRVLLPAALAVGFAFSAVAAESDIGDSNEVIRVTIDQAKVAKVPGGTSTLVIGNPMIADVTMLRGTAGMVITGKGYGQTNLIALDAKGNILDEKQLRVEPGNTVLVVQRGDARASYSCNPECMPTVQLGDDPKVFGETGGQIEQRNGYAKAVDAPK